MKNREAVISISFFGGDAEAEKELNRLIEISEEYDIRPLHSDVSSCIHVGTNRGISCDWDFEGTVENIIKFLTKIIEKEE